MRKSVEMLKKLSILMSVIVYLTGCDDSMNTSTDVVLSYGTSFGHCIGYCQSSLVLSGETATLSLADNRKELPIKENSRSLTQKEINQIYSNIKWDQFNNLADTIGCPDCADGGAEWVKIQNGKTQKKVTFEYGKAPKELSNLINTLRTITGSLDQRKIQD
jgi:hypothetical protein